MSTIQRRLALVIAVLLGLTGLAACDPSPSSITARTAVWAVDVNQQTQVVGNINPRSGGKTVVLERKISGRWYERGRATTNSNGAFSINIRPSQSGAYAFRVRSGGTSSPSFYLRVWFQEHLDSVTPVAGRYVFSKGERTMDGRRYTRALQSSSCSASGTAVEYDLGRRYGRVNMVIGLDDRSSSTAQRNYFIYTDGHQVASGTVRLGQTRTVGVNLDGKLRLKVEWRRAGSSCNGTSYFTLGDPILRR